jgi:predicted ATPase
VTTIPGRGYRFVAPISLSETTLDEPPIASASAHNLPALLTRLVGRTKTVETLVGHVQERRFITIAGPGGIGKTAVALAVADELSTHFRDSVRLVDFASLPDPALVPSTLASVLTAPVRSGDIVSSLITLLRDKEMLLELDGCEHVIEAAAALSAEILNGAPGIHILATSREPLRVNGERVHRLLPLEVPASSSGLSATQALAFSAIQLFVERATTDLDQFELNDTDAPVVADICRRLDGMPLAIELAAGCVDTFGIAGVAARLDDRFHLLTRGRRTALPRHQTLSATLNWSYELLPESERVILRRLAVFAGWFTMEAVSAIASGKEVAESEVVDRVANLAAKSLVAVDVGGATVHYRLLESTRAYALDKLKESGESELFARRHAEYFRDLFERAETERLTRPPVEWLAACVRQIDNVRTALDWAFSPHGDAPLGVALTVASVPLWRLMSLMAECRSRAQRALASLEPAARPDSRQAMKLLAALGAALRYGRDPDSEMEETWTLNCRTSRRCRLSAARPFGTQECSVERWKTARFVSPCTPLQRYCREGNRSQRFSRRRSHDRLRVTLPRRPDRRATEYREYAPQLRQCGPSFTYHSLWVRPAGARISCSRGDALAAGPARPGSTDCRAQLRSRSIWRSRAFPVQCAWSMRLSHRAVCR